MERITALNDRMAGAATDTARREVAKEIVELAKSLDLLIRPEEKKEKDTINLKDVTEEQRKKIEELLNTA